MQIQDPETSCFVKSSNSVAVTTRIFNKFIFPGFGPYKLDAFASVDLGDRRSEDRQLQIFDGESPGFTGRGFGRHPRRVVCP